VRGLTKYDPKLSDIALVWKSCIFLKCFRAFKKFVFSQFVFWLHKTYVIQCKSLET